MLDSGDLETSKDLLDMHSFTSERHVMVWNWDSSVELSEEIKRRLSLEEPGGHCTLAH